MSVPFDKIGKAVAMLSGTSDLEKLAAVRAIERLLKSSGSTFVQLGEAIAAIKKPAHAATSAYNPGAKSRGVADRDKAYWLCNYAGNLLTDREYQFCVDMLGRLSRQGCRPTERQSAWLDAIFSKTKKEVA